MCDDRVNDSFMSLPDHRGDRCLPL